MTISRQFESCGRKDRPIARIAAACVAAALFSGCATSTLEDPAKAGKEITINRDDKSGIAEAVLPNGLKILVLERPGIPVVSHQIWYRVGSVDERPGETGLAHYLEHVLFKGTNQIKKGEIDLITFRGGGSNNASTWNDFTAYYFNFESSRWKLALEIESDRMRNCTFVPKEFEAERGAVMNEMHAGHDSPGGRLDEQVDAAGYVVHPYHHPTIGWQQEVESVPRSRVIEFYDRYYMPNNATLVVVGDVKADDVVAAAAEAFSDVARGPEPPKVTEVEPVQRGEKRVLIVEDMDNPKIELAWTSCSVGDDDDYILDVVSGVLGTGKSSRLYRRLIEVDQSCIDISVWNETRKFPGRFKVWAEGQQGADPRVIEGAILDEVARLAKDGLDERELEKAKNNLLAREVYALETVQGTADRIGYLETVRSWRVFADWPERLKAVTTEQVQEAAKRYLGHSNRTVGWSVNAEAAALARPVAPGQEGNGAPEISIASSDGPVVARKADPPEEPDVHPTFTGGRQRELSLDMPEEAGGKVVLDPREVTLDNGMTVLLQPRAGLPVVSFSLYVKSGQLLEAKPGLAHFVGDLLDEGAGDRSTTDIAETLDFLGATLATGATGARARCLSKDSDEVLDLVADVVRRPTFPDAEINKVRAALLSEIAAEEDNPSTVGRKAFLQTIYGDHPWSRLARGDITSIATISKEDLQSHHDTWYVPSRAILGVAGDFDADAMEKAIRERFGDWSGESPTDPDHPEPTELESTTRVLRNMAGKKQSNVFIGNLAIRRNDPDYPSLLVMDHILGTGPGFTDRLSRDLRDEQGLAYTVFGRAASTAGEERGTFTGYIACLGSDLERAIDGMVGHLRRIREEPVTEQELADAKSYLTGVLVFRYETTQQLAGAMVDMHRFGLGFDYPAKFPDMVKSVTREDIQRVAEKHLHPDRLAIVVSGWTGEE
ncbi:MAG: M16 family metallopeptidase [Planctomycetota bacterium]